MWTQTMVSTVAKSDQFGEFQLVLLISFNNSYPDNRGFSWCAKNGEKRKTSEEIVSKSC